MEDSLPLLPMLWCASIAVFALRAIRISCCLTDERVVDVNGCVGVLAPQSLASLVFAKLLGYGSMVKRN